MNHVERARNRRDANAAFARRDTDPPGQGRIDFFGQALQAGAGKVELNAVELVSDHRIERLLKRRARESFGEDAELHQTPSFTWSSRMRSPVSTERATATSA